LAGINAIVLVTLAPAMVIVIEHRYQPPPTASIFLDVSPDVRPSVPALRSKTE
jgi:hypothetical protein